MPRRYIHTTKKFTKDVTLLRHGKDTNKLRTVIDLLVTSQHLPSEELKDYPLKGKFKGMRDLHIEPDWVFIYKIDAENIWLVRKGTHADLFEK